MKNTTVYVLVASIEVGLQHGEKRDVITKKLLGKGWKKNVIEKAFSLIEYAQTNKTHQTPY